MHYAKTKGGLGPKLQEEMEKHEGVGFPEVMAVLEIELDKVAMPTPTLSSTPILSPSSTCSPNPNPNKVSMATNLRAVAMTGSDPAGYGLDLRALALRAAIHKLRPRPLQDPLQIGPWLRSRGLEWEKVVPALVEQFDSVEKVRAPSLHARACAPYPPPPPFLSTAVPATPQGA